MTQDNRIYNSVYGMAFGDSWGYEEEFDSFEGILSREPKFPIDDALITDDTQMSLYGIRAYIANKELFARFNQNPNDIVLQTEVRRAIASEYVVWLDDPKNDRAPGNTCLQALDNLKYSSFETGLEGTIVNSKGCGANMRNAWFGLLPLSEDSLEELSIIQSEITHGHPLALSSAVLTAFATRASYEGLVLGDNNLYNYVVSKTEELLLKNQAKQDVRPAYVEGLKLLLEFLVSRKSNVEAFKSTTYYTNPCSILQAEGWVAEEALLLAIVVADNYADRPVAGLQRLVYSSGDSDSIAAIGGAILGANQKSIIFDPAWRKSLENDYIEQLDDVIEALQN